MAIVQITPPEPLPVSEDDYQAQNNLTDSRITNEIYPVDSGNVLKGAKFIIQGATFIANSDTLISGTASLYIKLVVSGSTATAEYITDLTGVTWSDVYNGYYNGSGEYVFFDEMLAFVSGVISQPKIIYNKIQSEITNQILKKVSDVVFNSIDIATLISGENLDITSLIQSSSLETGDINADTLNTGQGDNELYAMDQNVRTTDDLTFNNLALTGAFLPTEADVTDESELTTDGETFVLPRGLYNYIQITAAGGISGSDYATIYLERKDYGGSWFTLYSADNTSATFSIRTSDSLVSDGSDLRLRRVHTGTPGQQTIYSYRKS